MASSLLARAKSLGFSDRQIAALVGANEDEVRALRKKLGIVPSYRLVDTCAAEFEAYTPYYYSTYDTGDDEIRKSDKRKVMILGGGPNRIGQGIEFDYCCVMRHSR
jgi:carbamoyl-phosphate synthase large subunit